MNIPLRRALHTFGGLLGLAGILFVIIKLNTYSSQLDFSRFYATDWALIAFFAGLYGAANVLLAYAWFELLIFLGVSSVSRPWAAKVYGLSQLAKYVPGNIFHLAGRQAYGMAAGISAMSLAKSTAWELGLIAIAGALFSTMLAPFVLPGLPSIVAATLFVIIVATLAISIRRYVSRNLAWAFLWQVGFLIISGSVFVWILAIVTPSHLASLAFSMLCGAYVIAWLAGLVTPGAPAGIGIREAVLLFLLGNTLPHADLLLAVLLGRIVTVAGDGLYFMVSCFVFDRQNVRS